MPSLTLAFLNADMALPAAIIVLALLSPWLLRRRRQQAPRLKDIQDHAEEAKAARSISDKAMVDLLETSREILAQIDTRVRLLNRLVQDADKQATRLEQAVERSKQPQPAPEVVLSEETPAPDTAEVARSKSGRWKSGLHARVETLHREGKSAPEIARATRLSLQEVHFVLHLLAQDSAPNNPSSEGRRT